MSPYFVLPTVHQGLLGSGLVTLVALVVFGYVKGRYTTRRPWWSAWQALAVGGLAAGAAFGIARPVGAA